jgi:hypothetical protein
MMMRLLTNAAIALACVVLLPACDHGTDPKPKPTNFTANVVGDAPASLKGEAGFFTTPTLFVITLINTANRDQVIQFNRLGGAPAAGSYSLAGGPMGNGNFVGMYLTGGQESYVATDGVLTLTSVSADRISGTFSFAALGTTTGTAKVSADGHFDATRIPGP